MAWVYHQHSGYLYHNGHYVATGYSGIGAGWNNPDMENRSGRSEAGPIPRGYYRIGPAHHGIHTGRHVMNLTPIGHNAHGRTDLQMHGENAAHVGMSSTGCIVVSPLEIRQRVTNSGDDMLQVVR